MNFKEEFEVSVRCPICGEYHSVFVERMDFYAWAKGKSPQLAFPYLSDEEREIVISGICQSCWQKEFKEAI